MKDGLGILHIMWDYIKALQKSGDAIHVPIASQNSGL